MHFRSGSAEFTPHRASPRPRGTRWGSAGRRPSCPVGGALALETRHRARRGRAAGSGARGKGRGERGFPAAPRWAHGAPLSQRRRQDPPFLLRDFSIAQSLLRPRRDPRFTELGFHRAPAAVHPCFTHEVTGYLSIWRGNDLMPGGGGSG